MKDPLATTEFIRNLLAFCLIAAFVGAMMLFSFKAMPEANKDILTYMVGQLSGMATMALGFYFVNKVGQDAIDASKSDNTAKAFEAIKATAQAAGSDQAPDITLDEGESATITAEPKP